jgi:CBS domain containing-hemolysin-like protein
VSSLLLLALAVLLVALNGFFVGAAFALLSTRSTAVEALPGRRARIVRSALRRMPVVLAASQLGITLASLGLGAVGEPAVAHLLEGPLHAAGVPDALLHPIAFAIALALVVAAHMVLGEMVPKNLSLAAPETAALWLGPPLLGFAWLARPFLRFLNLMTAGVLRLLRVEQVEELTQAYTPDELARVLAESRDEGLLGPAEHERLAGALVLERETARSVLQPWAEVVTIRGYNELEPAALRTGLSRFPVVDDTGRVRGFLHAKDVLEDAPPAYRPVVPVPPDCPLREVLVRLREAGTHLAVVVEPGGGPVGLVTLDDALAPLIGHTDLRSSGGNSVVAAPRR